jgi:hypothetical protein
LKSSKNFRGEVLHLMYLKTCLEFLFETWA